MLSCAFCPSQECKKEHPSYPPNCPCRDKETAARSLAVTRSPDNLPIAVASALLEQNYGWDKTRLQEIVEFCRSMGYEHLGLAYCMGLQKEAKVFCDILRSHGFFVTPVGCKFGNIAKENLGLSEGQKRTPGKYDPMCNPVGQALFLEEAKTEFNILLGLCVGHDTLFIKESNTPMTVFAVKDRVLCHNPLGAVYTSSNFYKHLYKETE